MTTVNVNEGFQALYLVRNPCKLIKSYLVSIIQFTDQIYSCFYINNEHTSKSFTTIT